MRLRIIAPAALALCLLALPFLADAANASAASGLNGTLALFNNLFNNMIALFITMAIVIFFWVLIKYLWSMDQENAHEGIKIMFWGLIAIFVMVSIWGLIRLLQTTFAVGGTTEITAPKGVQLPYQ